MADPVDTGLVVANEHGVELTTKGIVAIFAIALGVLSYALRHPKETFDLLNERKPN